MAGQEFTVAQNTRRTPPLRTANVRVANEELLWHRTLGVLLRCALQIP